MNSEVLKFQADPQGEARARSWESLASDVPFASEGSSEEEAAVEQREFITKSPNRSCNFYLREIEREGRMPLVKEFVEKALETEHQEFIADSPEFEEFTNSYAETLDGALSYADKLAVHEYSGNGYKAMNQVARGYWDYEILGKQTPEALAHARELNEKVSEIILSAPSPEIDFATYRGTNMSTFRGYDVQSVSDLKELENQFFLEVGFCSTSLLRDKSFTNDNYGADIYRNHNVEIKYLIPKDSQECIGLLMPDLSRYPEENEFLINSSSFSYISKVEVTPDESAAQVEMVLIPRKVYDPVYAREAEREK